jgi:hypothetical protein
MAKLSTAMSDLRDLEPLSSRINTASDELNSTLGLIQDKLQAFNLGVEAWVTAFPPLDTRVLETVQEAYIDRDTGVAVPGRRAVVDEELGYARLGDSWGLVVRSIRYEQARQVDTEWNYADDPPQVREIRSLLRASRPIRVAAVARIAILIDVLKKNAEEVIDAVEHAKRIADSLK